MRQTSTTDRATTSWARPRQVVIVLAIRTAMNAGTTEVHMTADDSNHRKKP